MAGYYWRDHDATPVLLPRPPNTSAAVVFPMEINDSGVIVGYISTSPYRALRWVPSGGTYPTVEYLPDTGTGSLAYGIASDGTISGLFQGVTPRAVLWWSFGGYTLLHYTGTTTSGEANDVALTPGGSLVAAGYQGSKAGVRWRPSF